MSRSQRSTFSTSVDGGPGTEIAVDAMDERKAALFLHALTPTDRNWLIGRLPSMQRERLVVLLKELQTLGIPADRRLLEEAIAVPVPASEERIAQIRPKRAFSVPLPTTHDERCRMIDQADPLHMAAVLRGESAGLIARVLQLRSWSWQQVVLDHLTVRKRCQVDEYRTAFAARKSAVATQPVKTLEADTVAPASLGHALAASLSNRLWQLQSAQLPDARQCNHAQYPNSHVSQLQRSISWLKRFIRDGGKS